MVQVNLHLTVDSIQLLNMTDLDCKETVKPWQWGIETQKFGVNLPLFIIWLVFVADITCALIG